MLSAGWPGSEHHSADSCGAALFWLLLKSVGVEGDTLPSAHCTK